MHRRIKVKEEEGEVEHPLSTRRMELSDDISLASSTATVEPMADEQDDDCDVVIREIDVYLSPELSQQLYLLQYPGQHESSAVIASAASAAATPVSARIKPRHGILEAEHPAFHAGTTRTYQSQTIPVTTHLCLGKLMPSPPPPPAAAAAEVKSENFTVAAAAETTTKRDVLHLIPLTHITQMRPSFQHLIEIDDDDDNVEEAATAAAATNADGGDVTKKPIAFQRKESERAAAARKSSYAYKKASQEAEAWIDLTVVPDATAANVFFASDNNDNNNNKKKTRQLDDDLLDPNEDDFQTQITRNAVWRKIVCPNPHQSIWDDDAKTSHEANNSNNINNNAFSDASYVQSLNYLSSSSTDAAGVPAVSNNNNCTSSSGTGGGSSNTWIDDDDAKSIVTKLISLLQSGGPIPYSILRGQFVVTAATDAAAAASPTTSITDEVLLSALNVCAVLCRGNWCLHSNFLALSNSMKQVRTFLLLLLQSKGLIRRNRLLRVYSSSTTTTTKVPTVKGSSNSGSSSSRSNRNPIAVTPERLLFLLKLIAKQTRDGWVVKIDDDIKFIDQHPAVRTLHNTYWARQGTRFARELQVYEQDDGL